MIIPTEKLNRAVKQLHPFVFGACIGIAFGQLLAPSLKTFFIVVAVDAVLYLIFLAVLLKLDKRTY